jgi:hypothetical protein
MNSSNRGIRRRTFLAGLSTFSAGITFVLFSAAPLLGKKKKSPSQLLPSEDLPGQVESLGRQLLGTPLDESEPLTSQIQKLVMDHLDAWMTNQTPGSAPDVTPFDVRVRRQMENTFSKLHYPVFGHPEVFSQSWNGAVLTGAGYTLGWSDFDRVNVIALFESRQGKTRLVGIDHFVPYTDLHYAFPTPPDSTSFRFLAYGIRLGKSQPRLSAALYGYDGRALKSLWETRDVYDGKLEVEKDSVVIRYLKEDEYIRELTYNRKPPRHLAVYKSSPQGLKLDSDTEIPF